MAFIRLDQEPASFNRRRAYLRINVDALIAFLQALDGTDIHRVTGVPPDAQVIGVETLPWYMGEPTIKIYLQSEAFEKVELGAMAPELPPLTDSILGEVMHG